MGISNARVLTFRFRRLHLFRSSRNLLPRPGAKLIIFVLTVLLVLLQKVDPMAVCLRMIRPRKEMKKGEDDAATIGMRQVCDNMFG